MSAFVTLKVTTARDALSLEMPGMTTALYAAKRFADALGLDSDMHWILIRGLAPVPDDELASELVGERLGLAIEVDGP